MATATQVGRTSWEGFEMWKALPALRAGVNRVREIREEQLMTREELARRASVSLRTIWSVEAGHECRLETKRAILRALGIPRNQHRTVFPRPAEASGAESALASATPPRVPAETA